MHVLAGAREIPCALPLAHVLEDRAVALRPGMDGRAPGRIEQRALGMADDRAERHRRIGRTERGEPDLRDGLAQRLGRYRKPMKIRGFPLVGGHAVGGETLDVLDRAHALAHRLADVLGGDVVLKIDEGPAFFRLEPRNGDFAEHAARPALAGSDLDLPGSGLAETGRLCGRFSRCQSLAGGGFERVRAVAGADRHAVLRIFARKEALGRLFEGDLAARLREEMQRRRPAGGGEQRVDGDAPLVPAVHGPHVHGADAQPAIRAGHGMAGQHLDAGGAGGLHRNALRGRARVDDGGDADAGLS